MYERRKSKSKIFVMSDEDGTVIFLGKTGSVEI